MSESGSPKSKRKYNRRSDEQRIAELETQISQIKDRVEAKKRRDSAVLKEIPKMQRGLKRFADLAEKHGREDVANSASAFSAGLERYLTKDL